MSSGVGVVMAFAVGLTVLLKRGWMIAAAVTGPLAVAYGVYWLVERPNTTSVFGFPTIPVILRWVRSAEIAAFRGLGHYPVVSWLLLAVLVGGLVVAIAESPKASLRGRLAAAARTHRRRPGLRRAHRRRALDPRGERRPGQPATCT